MAPNKKGTRNESMTRGTPIAGNGENVAGKRAALEAVKRLLPLEAVVEVAQQAEEVVSAVDIRRAEEEVKPKGKQVFLYIPLIVLLLPTYTLYFNLAKNHKTFLVAHQAEGIVSAVDIGCAEAERKSRICVFHPELLT